MSQLTTHKRIIGVAYVFTFLIALFFIPRVDAYSCERVKGNFYDKDGKKVDETTFYSKCKYCVVENDGKTTTYYNRAQKKVSKESFYKDCGCDDTKSVELPNLQDYLENYYSFNIKSEGGNSYKISMDKGKVSQGDVPFTIVSANGTAISGKTVSIGKPATITVQASADNDYGIPGTTVELMAEHVYDARNAKECYYDKVTITLMTSDSQTETYVSKTCPAVERKIPKTSEAVDCTNYTTKFAEGSFYYEFCKAKTKATNYSKSIKIHDTSKGKEGYYAGKTIPFTCNSDLNTLTTKELQGESYFTNRSYIYGSVTTLEQGANYTMEYTPGFVTTGDAPSCEVTCEEAVEVAYGPPVAAKAGACFEYNVRVTSRVSCNLSKFNQGKLEDKCDYCTPSPTCYGYNRYWMQGGPNEEFDACIKTCDGGKYTAKCSDSCYKKVYGFESGNQMSNDELFSIGGSYLAATQKKGQTEAITDCKSMVMGVDKNGMPTVTNDKNCDSKDTCLNPNGCYYRSASGSISWKARKTGTTCSAHTSGLIDCGKGVEGRWYTENGFGTTSYSNHGYVFHSGAYGLPSGAKGFWRKAYDWGYCNDTCWWNMCSGSSYINPGYAERDYIKNVKILNETVEKCKAKETCRTTESTYTISAKVGSTTYSFPYKTGLDKITPGNPIQTTANDKNSTIREDFPEDEVGVRGCYKKDSNEKNLYRTTWGFPGTWRNVKTGEISFDPSIESDIWPKISGRFCLPDDAKDVNVNWYVKYYNKYLKERGLTADDVASKQGQEDCPDKILTTDYHVKEKEESLNYNIKASTRSFGYFGWNIDISCFYSWQKNTHTTTPSTKTTSTKCESGYTIRTVDLENLFPPASKTGGKTSTADSRTPGFNWTKQAYVSEERNSGYSSDPVGLANKIQKDAKGGYYSDNLLDYEFTITTAELKKIRSRSKVGGSYGSFANSGFKLDKNGNSRYKSTMIRDNSLIADKKLPREGALDCNNMVNYTSSKCWEASKN